jgi:ketosteroid isomerase-like protein
MTEAGDGGTTTLPISEKAGEWIAKAIKWSLFLGVAAALIFVGWLVCSTLLMPKGPFDDYPTTHEKAVRDYFTAIARGDKDAALQLVSFRKRVTNNPKEWLIYNGIADRINHDFTQKYGPAWINRMTIEPDDLPFEADGDAALAVVIANDRYIVTVEAQRPLDQMVQTVLLKREDTPHGEDGKNHFGVCEVEDYLAHTRDKDVKPKAQPMGIPAIPLGGAHPDIAPLPGDG